MRKEKTQGTAQKLDRQLDALANLGIYKYDPETVSAEVNEVGRIIVTGMEKNEVAVKRDKKGRIVAFVIKK